jgi:hypothetical protein
VADVLESLVVKLALDAADYDSKIKGASGALDGFAGNATKVGGALSLAVTTPLVALGGAAISAASDLNESMSKVSVVFGENATAIESWSTTAATSLGQSQQGALEAAGTFGNLFSAMGLGQDETLNMSKGVVQLASDLASFNNIRPEEALEKLRAGLVGEAEPLRTLGVNLTAAAVAAEAVRMGLAAQGEELTTAQKAQASYSLILQQTTAAQGDFTRTADGLANQQRIMQAELADTAATLGKELLPIALEVAKGLGKLLDWFKDLSPETKHWIVIIAGAAAAIGPVLVVLGTMAGAISAIIGVATAAAPVIAAIGAGIAALALPVTLVVAAIALLAAAWVTDFGGIRTKTQEFWGWLTGAWPGWMGNLKSGWDGFATWWQSDTQSKLATVQSGWQSFTGWLNSNTGGSLTTAQSAWQSFSAGVVSINSGMWDTIKWGTQTGVDTTKGVITAGSQVMQGDWQGGLQTLYNTGQAMWQSIYSQFQTQIDAITGIFNGVNWAQIGMDLMQGIVNGINNGISWIENAARDAAQSALDAAKWVLGISSPSKAASDELGMPFTQGMSIGAEKGIPSATKRIQAALDGMTSDLSLARPTSAAGAAGGTINITIYADSNDTAKRAKLGILDGLRAAGLA